MSLIVSAQADYKETEIPVAKLTLARQIGRLVVSLSSILLALLVS